MASEYDLSNVVDMFRDTLDTDVRRSLRRFAIIFGFTFGRRRVILGSISLEFRRDPAPNNMRLNFTKPCGLDSQVSQSDPVSMVSQAGANSGRKRKGMGMNTIFWYAEKRKFWNGMLWKN